MNFVDFGLVFRGEANNAVKKKVEDIMPIATGHEREELEAELQVMFVLFHFISLFSIIFICRLEKWRNKEVSRKFEIICSIMLD